MYKSSGNQSFIISEVRIIRYNTDKQYTICIFARLTLIGIFY